MRAILEKIVASGGVHGVSRRLRIEIAWSIAPSGRLDSLGTEWFPSYLLATDVTEDDRVVNPQRAGVARDRLNDRAAIVEVPTFRPLTRVRICYGRSWRRRTHVAEYKCATFVSVARRRIPESLSPCDAFVEEARAGGELPAQSTRHVIGRFSCIRTS